MGVVVAGETSRVIIAYCPFHQNRDTPAFNISLVPPYKWKCHNGKCAKRGNIITLLTQKGYEYREAERLLMSGEIEVDDLVGYVRELMEEKKDVLTDEWRSIDPENFRRADREAGYPARLYLQGRGISEEACEYFGIGYSASKRMLVIPVFDARSSLCGVIGRELDTKRYKYSTGLGRGEIVWNLNNAKVHDVLILTEGALDAVYVWQAGYPNVGAVLGSAISPNQWKEIRKHFGGVICFFDNDDAGNALRDDILLSIMDLEVTYVEYPERTITYLDANGEEQERPIKDPGELSPEEIVSMVENRKTQLDLLLNG